MKPKMTDNNWLSAREKEVAGLLLQGRSNKQIALALAISVNTDGREKIVTQNSYLDSSGSQNFCTIEYFAREEPGQRQ